MRAALAARIRSFSIDPGRALVGLLGSGEVGSEVAYCFADGVTGAWQGSAVAGRKVV